MKIGTLSAALIALASVAGAAQAETAGGLLGGPFPAAQGSDLFTFFNLAQTASRPCGGGYALGFRPTGEAFHKLAAVGVAVDGQTRVAAMSLTLDRAFIDAPGQGVFARDIAKSFIRDVAGPGADPQFVALADEIEQGVPPQTTVYSLQGAPPKPQGPPSPCYAVFLGGGAACELKSAGETLTLRDGRPEGEAVVRITFAASGGAPSGCLMTKIAD
jgi:hypothetical protein